MTNTNTMPQCDQRVCVECGWVGSASDHLVAPNPFDKDFDVHACPNCLIVQGTTMIKCYHPGCNQVANCGKPTPDGYYVTCAEHFEVSEATCV